MKLRLLFLLLLIVSNGALSAQNQSNDDWAKEFKQCDEENTPQKKPSYLSKTTASTYKKLIEQFKARRVRFGLIAGGYKIRQGSGQHVSIHGLVGNYYSVSNPEVGGGLVGVTYHFKSLEFDNNEYELQYSLSTYFFSDTTVQGYVTQENLFTNLRYQYKLSNMPSYIGLKLIKLFDDSRYNVAFDLGLGFNRISTSLYYETSLTPYSLPDFFFTADDKFAFSAMTGLGLKLRNAFGTNPLQCGYRFFYFGEGQLKPNNNLVTQGLKTGQNYANVIACEFSLG